ncbi:hypothetical protein CVD27_03105 [Neobacillus cucumis]|uniref:Arsenical resistance operon transcriptional repressor ArsD n=1 Tax=Neobacillus cucumis TaxID=1740721 RepID=A0A2N5HSA6_9BACI|nr:hypothetical protein CVD27_03105 [Neobacillus cucumis]
METVEIFDPALCCETGVYGYHRIKKEVD